MISINFFEFCEAPPIKKPFIEVISFNDDIFLGFTDPPYKTIGFLTLYVFFIKILISLT